MTHENKFGMFIHWGLYSIPAVHEQVIARYDIPNGEYEKYALEFNPTEYDPEDWVLLAKRAGMKYICFTTKHHDGFCMWDTKYTDYNIMNTPYGRDVLKMLADACQKHGMLLSLYYSNPDWHHEYGFNPSSTHQWKSVNKEGEHNTEKYREFVKNQIRELLTNYGPIYTFFWDIPPKIYDPSLNELVRELQPGIFINDRGWSEGDFSTPERELSVIEGKRFERMTEACNSVGEQSWGYREGEDFHTVRYLTGSIDRIMAMGGSYLLNVGPDSLGRIRGKYRELVERVGDWYTRLRGATECHEKDSTEYKIKYNEFIATRKNGKTYLHFYNGLASGAILISNPPSEPEKVVLLNTGATLNARIEKCPDGFSFHTGISAEALRISGIPADDLAHEAIVVEISW
ncbi:MAG: alpha-L-fucosidase [Clostridia bacterium]|nr:alpha-L-fucosidase [Clostridia bacterium]